MENNLQYEIFNKAWEKEVTEEVEAARTETLACMNVGLNKAKIIVESLKEDRGQILICMQQPGITKQDKEYYKSILKQTDIDIIYGECLSDVLEGIICLYQEIWNNVQLSEEEQDVRERWLFEAMLFLEEDENPNYKDFCSLIFGEK